MVSRRNYLTIAMMFVILLFMFQFTGVMKEQLSEYESNEYADASDIGFVQLTCNFEGSIQ